MGDWFWMVTLAVDKMPQAKWIYSQFPQSSTDNHPPSQLLPPPLFLRWPPNWLLLNKISLPASTKFTAYCWSVSYAMYCHPHSITAEMDENWQCPLCKACYNNYICLLTKAHVNFTGISCVFMCKININKYVCVYVYNVYILYTHTHSLYGIYCKGNRLSW